MLVTCQLLLLEKSKCWPESATFILELTRGRSLTYICGTTFIDVHACTCAPIIGNTRWYVLIRHMQYNNYICRKAILCPTSHITLKSGTYLDTSAPIDIIIYKYIIIYIYTIHCLVTALGASYVYITHIYYTCNVISTLLTTLCI